MALTSMKQAYLKFGAVTAAAVVLVIGFVALIKRDQRENARRVAAVKGAKAQVLKVYRPYFTNRPGNPGKIFYQAKTIRIGGSSHRGFKVPGKPPLSPTPPG